MAVTRDKKESKLSLRLNTGTNPQTQAKVYATRNINDLNPALADTDAYTIGDGIGDVLTDTLETVRRVDTATLIQN